MTVRSDAVSLAWQERQPTRDDIVELTRSPFGVALVTDLINDLLAATNPTARESTDPTLTGLAADDVRRMWLPEEREFYGHVARKSRQSVNDTVWCSYTDFADPAYRFDVVITRARLGAPYPDMETL